MSSINKTRTKAIIIGSADVIKLCLIRSLGTFGCDIDVIHLGKKRVLIHPVDYYSKYVNRYFYTSTTNLVQFIIENCSSPQTKPVIFTLDDYSTFLIDEARDKLKKSFLFAHLCPDGSLVDLMNKHLVKSKAAEAGMNVVKGWPIPFENGDFHIPEGIIYPCFVKGLQSMYVNKGIQCRCDSFEELQQLLESCKKKYPHPVYAEEFISIEKDYGVIGVSDGNKCIVPAKAELLEMGKGSSHGVSMLGKVCPLDNLELCLKIETLLEKLHYVGIFNVDFIESNGKLYFVELNFRYAAYGSAVDMLGCNLPAIFISRILGLEPIMSRYKMKNELVYFNEKIGLVSVIRNFMTLSVYLDFKRKADFYFVASNSDTNPYRAFIIYYLLRYIMSIFERVLSKIYCKS